MKLNIDYTLLTDQARTVGELLDKLNSVGSQGQTPEERQHAVHLLGIWNLLHKLLDDRER